MRHGLEAASGQLAGCSESGGPHADHHDPHARPGFGRGPHGVPVRDARRGDASDMRRSSAA